MFDSCVSSRGEKKKKDVLDDTGGLWCEGAVPNGPRADLVRTAGEVVDELHVQEEEVSSDPVTNSNLLESSRESRELAEKEK